MFVILGDVFYLNKIYKATRCYQSEIQEFDNMEHEVDGGSQYSHIHTVSRCSIPVDISKVEISPRVCFIKRQSLRSVTSWTFHLWAKAKIEEIYCCLLMSRLLQTSISPHHRCPALLCCLGCRKLSILASTRHPSNSPQGYH